MDSLTKRNSDKIFEKNKARHKIIIIGLILLCVIAVVVIFALITNHYKNRLYKSYKVENSFERKDSNTVQYLSSGGNVLKYSKDGASLLNPAGETIWNGGYEMDSPEADVCGNYAVVADVGAKQLFVYNGSDSGTKIDTTLPILQAKVAGQGVVAVLLEDASSNVIDVYNPYNQAQSLLVEVPTNVQTDGYPVCMDISNDGNSVVSAYVNMNSGTPQYKVSFYNFTEVGQEKNRLVGGKNYDQKTIADVEFVADDTCCIYDEAGFTLFNNMKQPKEVYSETFQNKVIKSVMGNNQFIGFVLSDAEDASKKSLDLYDLSGRKKLDKSIDYEYSSVELYQDDIIFMNSSSCNIIRTNGVEKLKCTFDKNVYYAFPADRDNTYYFINDKTINKVKLTEG